MLVHNKKTAIIYAFFDREESRRNLEYFFRCGGYNYPRHDYYLVVNLDPTKETQTKEFILPYSTQVNTLYRRNSGYDFEAYSFALHYIKYMVGFETYDYYFFLNASAFGPVSASPDWLERYHELFQQTNVHLVGSTINVCTDSNLTKVCQPHVQTYAFMMDRECVHLALQPIFGPEYTTLEDVVKFQEMGLSRYVLQHGWNISCLVHEYQGLDYRSMVNDPNPTSRHGDVLFLNKCCFGRDVQPTEIIFTKSNRPLHKTIISYILKHVFCVEKQQHDGQQQGKKLVRHA